jgi:hypothetical protein
MRRTVKYLLLFVLLHSGQSGIAQVILSGKVYDSTGVNPIPSVSIISNTGAGTATDNTGHYMIRVSEQDTIWFSYLGQRTNGFPVNQVWNFQNFDISLKVGVPVLKEVRVRLPDRQLDSIENRRTYAHIFNYKRPSFGSIVTSFGLGVTVDIQELSPRISGQKDPQQPEIPVPADPPGAGKICKLSIQQATR